LRRFLFQSRRADFHNDALSLLWPVYYEGARLNFGGLVASSHAQYVTYL
jgi:hypothetical protein